MNSGFDESDSGGGEAAGSPVALPDHDDHQEEGSGQAVGSPVPLHHQEVHAGHEQEKEEPEVVPTAAAEKSQSPQGGQRKRKIQPGRRVLHLPGMYFRLICFSFITDLTIR